MFARRLRVLLRIPDKKSFLRSSRDYVDPNLKFSTISGSQPLQSPSGRILNKSSFSIQKIEGYSNLSQTSDHLEESDDDGNDPSRYHPIHGLFKTTENRYSYSILEANPRYKKTIIPLIIPDETFAESTIEHILRKEWDSSPSASELIENFRILSYDARSNHKKFTTSHSKILNALIAITEHLLTDQIWLVLRYLEMWYPMVIHGKMREVRDLEETLDKECWKRAVDWDADDLLKTCDLVYHLRRVRNSQFVGFALKKLGLKPSKMSSDNYPHYMHLLSISRRPHINMYELEYRLEAIVEEYSVEELAIIAMGFFKTETPIRNPGLSGHIVQKCVDNMENVHEIFITAIFKMARHSIHLRDREIVRSLLRRFKTRINAVSTVTLVHAAHTGASSLIFEKEVMDSLMNELVRKGLADARLKDIERILFSLMLFIYPKEYPLYEMALEQLRSPARTSECRKFAVPYACSVMYLSLVGIYPMDIITRIMNPDYLKDVYKNNAYKVGREYLITQCGLELEVPEYKGPFLPEKIYNYLAKKYASGIVWRQDPSNQIHTYTKFLNEVVHYLKPIVGEKNYYLDQVLPQHQRADIIICLDADKNFISPQEMMLSCPAFKVKFTPGRSKNYKWFAVVLGSHNHIFRGTTILSGTSAAKMRHLEIAGYTPISILMPTWMSIKAPDRPEYLRHILTKYFNSDDHREP